MECGFAGWAIEPVAGLTTGLEALRAIGPEHFFVSSDSGLIGTPNHPDALVMAAHALRQNGFDEQTLNVMFKHNPARLLGLPPL